MTEHLLKPQAQPTPHPTAQYWRKCQVEELFDLTFLDLIFQAASVHRQNFDPHKIQISALLSIKTGGCPEDCAIVRNRLIIKAWD